jgi:hypothetical protein
MDSFKYDHLLEDVHGNALDDDDHMTSNFIVLLASEKLNNPTLEFKRVHRELESLAGSLPLIVLNQQKLLTKLLGYLENKHLKPVYKTVLELLIALVKDLRQDIYEAFLN